MFAGVSVSILTAALACGIANAQETGEEEAQRLLEEAGEVVEGPVILPQGSIPMHVAFVGQLRQMFTQYPPSLLQVLQLDPTLLNERDLFSGPTLHCRRTSATSRNCSQSSVFYWDYGRVSVPR
jgi:hypothetical protein